MMNKIRRKRQRAALMLFTAAGIMLSLAGIAAARYMKQESQSGVVEAQTFYFTSDLLKEDGGTAAYLLIQWRSPSQLNSITLRIQSG